MRMTIPIDGPVDADQGRGTHVANDPVVLDGLIRHRVSFFNSRASKFLTPFPRVPSLRGERAVAQCDLHDFIFDYESHRMVSDCCGLLEEGEG